MDTHILLKAFVDELVRNDVCAAVTSPGSRNAPLVLALAGDGRLQCHSVIDERSAGFFALGLAKATGRPAVVACTSGTAAANYAPAVNEADQAGVPLIVLTADRPPELRDVGAGQTIGQIGLYGSAVRWFVEFGTHAHSAERERWVRTLCCRVVQAATGERHGPVHVNVALREPLVPDGPVPEPLGGRGGDAPWLERRRPAAPVAWTAPSPRGVVVCGRVEHGWSAVADAVAAFAGAAGWPVLADPLSGARRGAHAIAHYDALLRAPGFGERMAPDAVLRVGDLPTSKPLRTWLADLGPDVPQTAMHPTGTWHDPDGVVEQLLDADPVSTLRAAGAPEPEPGWAADWRAADDAAAGAIDATLGDELSDAVVARELGGLDGSHVVFIAASMPIRDAETFWPAADEPPRALAHRGANGIDGTISAALGAAAAGKRVVCHLGDVALAHDVGALATVRRLGLDLTLVVVDNGGGAVFDFLAIATQGSVYEEHIATPPGLDIPALAAAFGLAYDAPSDLESLRNALHAGGARLVHVRTDRAANVADHRAVWGAVGAAVRAPG
jgi:2-succinyl-5-enolpyruvyl-6-hydroxy-3-cyclohexene-1-carboxylate synthase